MQNLIVAQSFGIVFGYESFVSHIRKEVEQQNAAMRHQRMMFSQEFLDFHHHIVWRNFQAIKEGKEKSNQVSAQNREVVTELISISASFLFNIGCRLHSQYRKINFMQRDGPDSLECWNTLLIELIKLHPPAKNVLLKYFDTDTLKQFLLRGQIFLAEKLHCCGYTQKKFAPTFNISGND